MLNQRGADKPYRQLEVVAHTFRFLNRLNVFDTYPMICGALLD